jgi:hypothetical protein
MLDKLMSDPERPGYFEGYKETHNWTHKCALWKLLYMLALILMHNIDVMHQERNKGESIISTCMDFSGKTKGNMNAQKDLTELCNCPSLDLKVTGGKSRASFCLKPQQKKEVMCWMKGLKFLDGYAAGLRRSVNMTTEKLIGLKSHDYHIIMKRLMPIMFRGYFDDAMWMVLVELSYFYRQLCATIEMMQKLENEISVLLCVGLGRATISLLLRSLQIQSLSRLLNQSVRGNHFLYSHFIMVIHANINGCTHLSCSSWEVTMFRGTCHQR